MATTLLLSALALTSGLVASSDISDQYEPCRNHSALCFGMPNNCVANTNCQTLFRSQYQPGKKQFHFELLGSKVKPDQYIAVATTNLTRMSGLVVHCHYSSTRSKVILGYSLSTYSGHYNSPPINGSRVSGYSHLTGSYSNGVLHCSWQTDSPSLISYDQYKFDLENNKFYLQLASGKMKTETTIGYHHHERIASAQQVSLKQTSSIHGRGIPAAIRWHAILMILGWIGCMTPAILMARHARGQWLSHQWFGLQIWFVVHRTLMAVGWLSVMASYVVLFVHFGTWTKTSYHSVAGLVAGILATLQMLNSFFRPSSESRHRWIFNYVHWIMGNLSHILALSNIVKSGMKQSTQFFSLLLVYLFIYLVFTDLLKKLVNEKLANSVTRKTLNNVTILSSVVIMAISIALSLLVYSK